MLNDAVRIALAAALAAGGPALHAATILQWDIPVSAVGTAGTTSGATPTNGAGASGVSGTVITINGSLNGQTSSSGWRWYDQTGNTDLTTALSGTNYFSWNITTNGVTTATITGLGPTFFSKGASAPNSLALLYSTTSDFSSYRTVSGSTAIPLTTAADLSSGLAGDLASNNIVLTPGSTGYFRLAFWGASSTTSGAIWTGSASTTNDFSLVGTATSSVAQRTLTWNGVGGGGSTWNNSTGNLVWLDTGSSTYFNDGDNANFTSASTVNVTAGGVSAGNLAVSNTSGSVVIQGGALTAGTLTKTGAGTLTLNAANTFSGVTGSAGVIQIADNGALGTSTVTLDNTQLSTTAAVTSVANAINVGSNGATLNTAGSGTFGGVINTVAGAAANVSYALTKSGTGQVTINKTFGTQMSKSTTGGAFNLTVGDGSLVFAGNVQRNLGGAMTWTGNVSLTGGTLMLHAADITGSGTVSIDGAATIQSRLSFGRSTIANRLLVGAPLTANASANASLEFTGTMTGTAGITTAGSGAVRLKGTATDGVNTLSGPLSVGATTEVYTQSLGNLAPTISAGQILRFIDTTTGTFAGAITGAGIVGIGGSAKVVLSGSNTYAGGTQLDGDVGITTVSDGTSGSLGTGTITSISSAGRIFLESGTSITFTQVVNTGTASTSVLAFAGTGKTFLLAGSAAGSGQLKASSGATLDLTSQSATTNTNTGGIEIGNAFVRAAADANLGTGTINFSGTDSNSGWIAAASGTISRAFTIGGTGTNANIKAVFDTAGYDLTLTGPVNDKANTALGGLTKVGLGSLTLSASNGYTGATTVSAGTLVAGNPKAFGTGTVTLNGGTLDLGAQAMANAIVVNGGLLANLANYGGMQTLFSAMTYSGTVGGTLNVASGGTLKGSGVTFTGPVVIGDGAIHAPGTSPGAETFSGGLTYGGSSTLQWELVGNTVSGPGSNYDQVTVSGGALSILSGASLALIFNGGGSAVNWNDAFWNSNRSWTVIDASGAAASSGTFTLLGSGSTWLDANSLSLAAAMSANNRDSSTFVLDNSSGSTVLLYQVVISVPEPGTLALAAAGIAAVAAFRASRRRRR